mmetsp:Transcript_3145/g.7102  ORF Transcript_3145/g.7102 Transcript_3145/m.7102 type:complete len:295 (+) Transcript_3145:414-1298(+)
MLQCQLLDAGDDGIPATARSWLRLAHALRAEVGVASSTIPVTRNWLRIERAEHTSRLARALEQVAADNELVTGADANGRSHLVLPLSGHHLAVDAADVHTGKETRLVVSIADVASEHAIVANGAVVRSLRSRIPVLRPSKRPVRLGVEESVLLLNSVPRYFIHHPFVLEDGSRRGTRVGLDGISVGLVAIADDENVFSATEWIAEDSLWLEENLAIFSRCLSRAASVEVPDGKFRGGWRALPGVEGARLGSQSRSRSIDPDVLRNRLGVHGQALEEFDTFIRTHDDDQLMTEFL